MPANTGQMHGGDSGSGALRGVLTLLAIMVDVLRSGMPGSTASKWLNWGEGDHGPTMRN